jgi:hypothetical protein
MKHLILSALVLAMTSQSVLASEPTVVALKAGDQLNVFDLKALKSSSGKPQPVDPNKHLRTVYQGIGILSAAANGITVGAFFGALGGVSLFLIGKEKGDRVAMLEMRPLTEDELNQSNTLNTCAQRQAQMLSALLDRSDVKQMIEERNILKTQVQAIDMNSALITRFDSQRGEFKIKRPSGLAHRIEELGSFRGKHYSDVPAIKAEVVGNVLTVGAYEFKGTCISGDETDVLKALQSAKN